MEAKAEIWRGKDGKGFGEDGGYGVFAGEVWVELVSVWELVCQRRCYTYGSLDEGDRVVIVSDRANNKSFMRRVPS